MGLASALSTALTGLTAAETTIDVVGNNLANSNTVGFKASEAVFATQFLQTQSLGSAPSEQTGGTNPRQIGLGTLVAEITPNFNQGTVEVSASPSDLAIQGDGFFMVQGTQGDRLYTRNGIFKTNSENQLVSVTGNRLMGFGIDDEFQIQTTEIVPIEIPLGSAAVAEATDNVWLEGTLRPDGELADTAEIIQTGILTDGQFTAPPAGTNITSTIPPDVSTTTQNFVAGGGLPDGTYRYRVVYADGAVGSITDTEGMPSLAVDSAGTTIAGGGGGSVQLNNIPDPDPTGNYSYYRIYRSVDGGAYQYMAERQIVPGAPQTTWTDDGTIAPGAQLNEDFLSGTTAYSYFVTFGEFMGGGRESRPSPLIGPQAVTDGRVQLTDLPTDTSGQWNTTRIYRHTADDNETFYLVAEIPSVTTPGLTFTDNVPDSVISDPATPGYRELDREGPIIQSGTLLVDLLYRDGTEYRPVFPETGRLEFTGRKGGRTLETKSLEVTDSTTLLDLLDFMEQAMGIQVADPTQPYPVPPDGGSGRNPGGYFALDGESRISLIGNNGVDNALDVPLSGLQLFTDSGQENIDLPFTSVQSAAGESAVADFIAYDSLGIPISVRVTSVLESRTSTSTTYRWFADSADNSPAEGVGIAVGTGLITFDGEGKFLTATDSTVSVDRRQVSSASPLEFELDFSQISGLAAERSWLAASRQDGSAPGVLTSFIIGEDGVIRGVFSNGVTRDLGQIRLARFANPAGLEQRGENMFAAGVNSGLPIEGNPGEQGIGTIIAGAVELSNTDIGSNLIDLILASTMYRGNTRVITTSQQMLDELLSIRR